MIGLGVTGETPPYSSSPVKEWIFCSLQAGEEFLYPLLTMRALLPASVFSIVTVVGLFSAANGQAQPQEGLECSTYASCNELGTDALQQGRSGEAIRLFEKQAGLAELADIERQSKSREALLRSPCKLALTAYNNLAVSYLNKHDYPELVLGH